MSTKEEAASAVAALVVRERWSRDRSRWGEMAACFTPDATIAMSWYRGPAAGWIERSRSMDVAGSRGVHRLSPPAAQVPRQAAVGGP